MRTAFLSCLLLSLSWSAWGTLPAVVEQQVEKAAPVGSAMFTYYFWDVYEATLYAPQGDWSASRPFALALTYQRDFDGEDIARRSVKEIRKQGVDDEQKLARWGETMTSLFPDVEEGETLLGVVTSEQYTLFYRNDTFLGEVKDTEFTRRFFAIWLGEETSEPALRKALLNQNNGE